ncbi:MAG: hypothetical protein KDD69_19800, partial [Bdellovibrionales bacterium]|nr:hypothetical protein [Bdellovibrionales bacterium]
MTPQATVSSPATSSFAAASARAQELLARGMLVLALLASSLAAMPEQAEAQGRQTRLLGVWNGFNEHAVVVEVNNTSDSDADLLLTVQTSAGIALGAEQIKLPAKGTQHVALNKYGIVDNHGTYVITAANGGGSLEDISGLTVFYRFLPPGSVEPLEYAFAIPFVELKTGIVAGIYNSFDPSGGVNPVFNWLSVVAPPDARTPFRATVQVYDQGGTLDTARSFRIAGIEPGQRLDFPLGHEQGQVVGIYRIVPDSGTYPYSAFLSRYNQSPDGGFRSAFFLESVSGSCSPETLPASTMDPATNWGEIANISSETAVVDVLVRDQSGVVRRDEQIRLAPYSQQHFLLNVDLGSRNLGTFSAACSNPDAPTPLLVQSVYYGHLNSQTAPLVEWAYASQATESLADAALPAVFHAPINTFLGAFNWYKTAAGAV